MTWPDSVKPALAKRLEAVFFVPSWEYKGPLSAMRESGEEYESRACKRCVSGILQSGRDCELCKGTGYSQPKLPKKVLASTRWCRKCHGSGVVFGAVCITCAPRNKEVERGNGYVGDRTALPMGSSKKTGAVFSEPEVKSVPDGIITLQVVNRLPSSQLRVLSTAYGIGGASDQETHGSRSWALFSFTANGPKAVGAALYAMSMDHEGKTAIVSRYIVESLGGHNKILKTKVAIAKREADQMLRAAEVALFQVDQSMGHPLLKALLKELER